MQLIQSKSLLAKLMATENLLVEERKCSTASFDVKNRILTIPILDKKLSIELYDLFTGHEVGHALYTPLEGMKAAIESKTVNSGILNVVEDVRIEKKIQSKFPGLRGSFLKAYNELLDRDFFDTNGKDLNQLNFIDRINMHSKGGAQLLIKFNDEEKELLNEVQNTETYEEVIDVAKRIQEFMKKQAEEKREEEKRKVLSKKDANGENEDDMEMEHGDDPFELNDFEDFGDDVSEVEDADSEVKSFTDEAYRRNENRLLDQKSRNLTYMNVPSIDTKKAILDFKELYAKFVEDEGTLDHQGFQKLRKESEKIVSYLVKEFEMRKNAEQMKRASVAKTGELNMSKIYSYGFSEDLFKRITVVPNGKSHGLVMFIDWSGSMQNHLKGTVKQLFNLVLFCRKVSIPYEVYAFSNNLSDDYNNGSPKNYKVKPKIGDMRLGDFRLLNILSSRMGPSDFTTACAALCSYCNYSALTDEHGQMTRRMPKWFTLGSTPLNESIIAAMKIVPEFKNKYKLQKVHAVFLTDGEADAIDHVWTNEPETSAQRDYSYVSNIPMYDGAVIRHPATKEQVYITRAYRSVMTKGLIELLRETVDCTVIGYYLLSSSELRRNRNDFFESGIQLEEAQTNFRRNKFAIVKSAGYDEYYLLKSEESSIYAWKSRENPDDDFEEKTFEVAENATRRGIASAFIKHNTNKVSNRVVLNRFINLIA